MPKNITCPNGKVCLSHDQYNRLVIPARHPQSAHFQPPSHPPPPKRDLARERDMRVLTDPLYPALNRTDNTTFNGVADYTQRRIINVPTYTSNDSYRMIGYMINEDDETSKRWKLFGRMKDRNRGEFYMVPVDRTLDMKVQITDSMVIGTDKMRDVDTIPKEVQFDNKLLAETPYSFVELPKGDIGEMYM